MPRAFEPVSAGVEALGSKALDAAFAVHRELARGFQHREHNGHNEAEWCAVTAVDGLPVAYRLSAGVFDQFQRADVA